MRLIEYIEKFPTEESCRIKFKEYREKLGVVCPKCGCTVHYWIGGKTQSFQCKECGHRQTLRANTTMYHSHLSFKDWFITMHLMTSTKGVLSTAEIARQLDHKNYNAIWYMVQKIRHAIEKAESEFKLTGEVELDTAFFTIPEDKNTDVKFSRDHIVDVLVMAESVPAEKSDYRYKTKYHLGRVKMVVIPNKSAATIKHTALQCIDKSAIIRSDGDTAHNILKNEFEDLKASVLNSTADVMRVLPYVHLNIGWSKDRLKYIFHGVDREYIQMYLTEYCWKINHRYDKDLFYRLLKIVVGYSQDWGRAYRGDLGELARKLFVK